MGPIGVRGESPQIPQNWIFALYGRRGPLVGRKILPRGVGTFSRPGNPFLENHIYVGFGTGTQNPDSGIQNPDSGIQIWYLVSRSGIQYPDLVSRIQIWYPVSRSGIWYPDMGGTWEVSGGIKAVEGGYGI